jgi:uncharacterized membrane protein YccC
MSTETAVEISENTPDAGRQTGRRAWTRDLRTVRIMRFAVGVTAAAAIAFGIEWSLYVLTPVFTAFFLSLPLPAPTARQILDNILYVLAAMALGIVFTHHLLPYPMIYVLALGLLLFHIYYLANRGGPIFLVLLCLIAVLILPMLLQTHEAVPVAFVLYFALSSLLAILLFWLAHMIFPDPPSGQSLTGTGYGGFHRGYSREAALTALKSTIAILPLATLYIALRLTDEILVMVFAAIFSLSPQLSKGTAAALKSLTSTLIGGLAALLFYLLIVAVPEYHFFIALMLLTTLLFGAGVFSDKPLAKYLPSALIALLILVSSSTGEGADFTSKFVIRVVLISAAALYVVAILSVLDHFWQRKTQKA